MATATSYLRLEYIPVAHTNWYNTYQDNLMKIDVIGKAIRMQTAAGKSMAIRAELANGSLIDAIRIVPDANRDSVAIYLGRSGKEDRVVIESSSLFSSLNLANQNATAAGTVCSIGATWTDEDGTLGDPTQSTTVLFDPRNNLRTTIVFPPASASLITNDNPYLGSGLQLGTDPSGNATGTPHLKFICETQTGSRTFLVPAYSM
jgi:hypothetical protein